MRTRILFGAIICSLFVSAYLGWMANILQTKYLNYSAAKDVCFEVTLGFAEGIFDTGQTYVIGTQIVCAKELYFSSIYNKNYFSDQDVKFDKWEKVPRDFRDLK